MHTRVHTHHHEIDNKRSIFSVRLLMRFFTKTHMEFAQIMSELQNSKCPPTMWDIELSDILPDDVEDRLFT